MHSRSFTKGAVATPHYLATSAGLEVLAAGGNAVDAIVAANLALGVVAPYYCGYGGDLFAIVWDGALHGYRSAGRSAAETSIERVRADSYAAMPVFGPHAVTVPGAVRGWFDLIERFATRDFATLSRRALLLAEEGFMLSRPGAFRLAGSIGMIEAVYPQGAPALTATYADRVEGAVVRQPSLGRTIRALAADGPSVYYDGPIGTTIAETVRAHGGCMTDADLRAHSAAWVEPLSVSFAGRTVYELPPPTQGVTALEMLAIAAEDGKGLTGSSWSRDHRFVEIAKLALLDRDEFVTDPGAMDIDPMSLLSPSFVAERAGSIGDTAREIPPRRTPDGGTAYLCAADADGLCVSLIQSNFTAIGSGVHVGEWGINLQNRGASFSLDSTHVNALAPAKLPMHTLIPAMILRDGEPEFVFGTMGGHAQAQVHLQILTRLLVDGLDPQSAVDAPRWSVDPATGELSAEARFATEWFDEMDRRGHRVRRIRPFDDGVGHAHTIERTTSGLRVGCDPRAESAALGL